LKSPKVNSLGLFVSLSFAALFGVLRSLKKLIRSLQNTEPPQKQTHPKSPQRNPKLFNIPSQ